MNPLGNDEFIAIIEKLTGLTKTTLVWTAEGDTSFKASSGRFTYWISSQDGDGAHPYNFIILSRDNGNTVAEVSTGEEATSAVLFDRIERLYDHARRDALGIDKLASEIAEDLNELAGPDEAPF